MLIGCIHVLPTPSTSGWAGFMNELVNRAETEARLYAEAGVDAILVENMHDVPYVRAPAHPGTVAAMAVVADRVKQTCKLPTGIQILAGANVEALSVAVAANLDFLRVEGFVFAHVGDEGLIQSCAGELLRQRSYLKAEGVRVYVDIKKKHSAHAITNDLTLSETARAAEFFHADGVIVTGETTGAPPKLETVEGLKDEVGIPVFIGSGITDTNLERFSSLTDGVIVGSYFKEQGHWKNPVDRTRVEKLVGLCRQEHSR